MVLNFTDCHMVQEDLNGIKKMVGYVNKLIFMTLPNRVSNLNVDFIIGNSIIEKCNKFRNIVVIQ